MAPKSQPATNLGPSAIDSDKQIVAWNTVLLPLKSGRERIKTEIDSLTLEEHFGSQAHPPASRKRPTVTRDDQLRDRLRKNRAAVPEQKATEPLAGELPAAVSLALEIINTTRSAPTLVDRRALREQRKHDLDAVDRGIASLESVIHARREELKYAQVVRDADPWFALLVRRFRAYAAAAAIDDELSDFMRSRLDAGYVPWRGDLLPELALRVKLTLGSERDYHSELSVMRRKLEELKRL